ncbi:MAG TPA: dienelactone hydrolase family protein [Chitinophagaceae bacterium]
MKSVSIFLACLLTLSVISCNEAPKEENKVSSTIIKEENVSYAAESDSVTLNGFVAYDSASTAKRPVVLVVHEWWGLNDYIRGRAKQLAEMGYFALAVDMFGNNKMGNNPQEAQALVTPFYTNPRYMKTRIDAAMRKLSDFPQADTANVAAIGYCFGGTVVLNTAKLGENFKGVVSFHGGLEGPAPDKSLLKAKVLVCHGGADAFVPQDQVDHFKKQMDSVGADYTFKVYDSATHAFSNPNATAVGKQFNLPIAYNAAADTASWNDMKAFFGRIFPNR